MFYCSSRESCPRFLLSVQYSYVLYIFHNDDDGDDDDDDNQFSIDDIGQLMFHAIADSLMSDCQLLADEISVYQFAIVILQ